MSCWWLSRIWELNCNQCFHYTVLFPLTPDPFLEIGLPSVHDSWLMRTERQCKWQTGSGSAVMTAPVQVLSLSPGTGIVQMFKYSIHDVPGSRSWNTHRLDRSRGRGAAPGQTCFAGAPVRRRWGFSGRAWLSFWAWGLLCIGEVPEMIKEAQEVSLSFSGDWLLLLFPKLKLYFTMPNH